METNKLTDVYKLSPMQTGMLFHFLVDKKSNAYFQQYTLSIKGEINKELFNKSINFLLERYDILRTIFYLEYEKHPLQVVLRERKSDIHFEDISHLEEKEKYLFLEEFKKKDREKGFDLTMDLLFRVALFKTGENDFELTWSFHHILMDGWCLGIIFKDLVQFYQSLKKGHPPGLKTAIPYKIYINWLEKFDKEEGLKYWQEYLAGFASPTPLPKPGNPTGKAGYEPGESNLELDERLSESLRNIARQNHVTVNIVFQVIWAILLQRYNNTDDVIFGEVVSGRTADIKGIEDMVGLFINTIPTRVKTRDRESLPELLVKVREQSGIAKAYEYLPLAEIQTQTPVKSKLIDHIFVFENYPLENKVKDINVTDNTGFIIKKIDVYEQTNYDFNIIIVPGEQFLIKFRFNRLTYAVDDIKRTASHFKEITRRITGKNDIKTSEIEILTREERQQILYHFNDTACDYPQEKSITRLFEEQVDRVPDRTAIIFRDEILTFNQLNRKANQLARLLKEKGGCAGSVVGLPMERSARMIIGIMAILKAGSIYLPIDPQYPGERIDFILKDSSSTVLLTVCRKNKSLQGSRKKCRIINLEDLSLYRGSDSNLNLTVTSREVMYLIYTSGSTGKPKGVMIEHRSLVNRLHWMQRFYPLDQNDIILQKTSICFDVSIWELSWWSLEGASLYLLSPGDEKVPSQIARSIARNKITVVHFVPSMLNTFLDYIENDFHLPGLSHLKIVFSSGETLTLPQAVRFGKLFPGTKLVNLYGPTEAAIDVSYYDCRPAEPVEKIPIGKPIDNINLLILNRQLQLQPVNIPGELCIAGDGLARGYANRPQLTAERFCLRRPGGRFLKKLPREASGRPRKNFLLLPQSTIYKTGDLARWLPDGNIEFLGRQDDQVKIRGFRVELGEIETRLLQYEAVKETVVLLKEDRLGDKYLCAYYVTDKVVTTSELREFAAKSLPAYMVPAHFVHLPRFPLKPNGKIDRKALPEPGTAHTSSNKYAPPGNKIENQLVDIWQEVLDIKNIGIDDNFFEIGGHSLKAMVLASRIHKSLNVSVPLREIFNRRTIKELATCIAGEKENIYKTIKPVEKKEYYPVSSAQKRLFFLYQLEKSGTNYNMPAVYQTGRALDKTGLEKVIAALIQRHESLRTSFKLMADKPVQVIHQKVEFKIEGVAPPAYIDTATEGIEEGRVEGWNTHLSSVIRHLSSEFVRPFDLSKAPLLRAGIGETPGNEKLILFDMHHIVSDGVSGSILENEFIRLYNGEIPGELKIHYKEFSEWQNRLVKSEALEKQEKYWLDRFKGEIPVLNMPMDNPRPAIRSFAGENISFELSGELCARLRRLLSENGTTLFMVLLAAFNVLLAKYTGQEDIVVGSPTAGRPHADLENIIGMFVNTLALRNYPAGHKSFKEFLQELKESSLDAYENQDYQFEELVEKLEIRRDMSRNPLFDTMFLLNNIDNSTREKKELTIKPYEFDAGQAKFDMMLIAFEGVESITFNMNYCSDLFTRDRIKRLGKHFVSLLRQIVDNPGIKLSTVDMLSEKEKRQILIDFNDTTAAYPQEKTIHQLFAEQAEKAPANLAVVFEDRELTYRELNNKANRLARVLREKGVKVDGIVGITVEPSLEMIVGILGILKAGGAYLPLAPQHPPPGIKYMMKDSGSDILLSKYPFIKEFEKDCQTIDLGEPISDNVESSNPENFNTSADLAYTIYTSGSTGTPKGVVIKHHSVINLVTGLRSRIYKDYSKGLNVCLLAPFFFDASVKQIFAALLLGHSLYMAAEDIRMDGTSFIKYYRKHEIDISDGTPVHLRLLVENTGDDTPGLNIKHFIIGGEALAKQVVEDFISKFAPLIPGITNVYGPTECCVDSTSYHINPGKNGAQNNIPIGSPLPNHYIYILDKSSRVQPVSIPGELCIGGDGLARGYVNRPELTAERFCLRRPGGGLFEKTAPPGPPRKNFLLKGTDKSHLPYSPIYRTGDLARWQPDGNIEFLGRQDDQVKIRGFRLELGEIEHRLLQYEAVKETVVLLKEDKLGDKYLCAYYVTDRAADAAELRGFLAKSLPAYMIPAHFVHLPGFPLTPNGKIDRKALPAPGTAASTTTKYVPPSNEIESKLVDIWQEVLDIKNIGINHNFFEVGGHSLKAMVLVSRIHKNLNLPVPLRQVFNRPTIQSLALYIAGQKKSIYETIKPVEKKEYYPVSSAQKRLFFLYQLEKTGTNYNMPSVRQTGRDLDKTKLEKVSKALIQQHESLRTSFKLMADKPVQVIHQKVEFKIEGVAPPAYIDTATEVIEEGRVEGWNTHLSSVIRHLSSEFVRPFDLSTAPLLRVGIGQTPQHEKLLLFDMHHIVSDGVSRSILENEFIRLYNGEALEELKIQYKEFSEWQNRLFKSKVLEKQEKYWRDRFKGEIPVLNMPTDNPRAAVRGFAGENLAFEMGGERYAALKQLMSASGTTLFMVLLCAFNVLLAKYTGQEDIVVASPTAGRPHTDLESIIGMFVNTLALRNTPAGNKSLNEFLQELKEGCLEAYENQDYPFEELVDRLDIIRDLSRNPLFDAMLVLNNIDNPARGQRDSTFKPDEWEAGQAKFDMTLIAFETDERIIFNINYRSDLFRQDRMARLGSHFLLILKQMPANRDKKLSRLDMLSEEEKQQILLEFNETRADYPREKTINELFARQVEKYPGKVAVVFEDRELTYRELNQKANRLGRVLREKGVKADSIVGLMVDPSLEMLAGILGILNAGGAYLPLAPEHPLPRIKYMMKDSGSDILLSKYPFIKEFKKEYRTLDLGAPILWAAESPDPENVNSAADLAYILYTSGSTGLPKGAAVSHGSLLNLVAGLGSRIYNHYGKGLRVCLIAPFFFDASVQQIFTALLQGHCLYIIPGEVKKDGIRLIEYYRKYKIEISDGTPTHLRLLLEGIRNDTGMLYVRHFLIGGEVLPKQVAANFSKKFKPVFPKITNVYGLTECCVDSASHEITAENINLQANIPIGKPMPNQCAYILDKAKRIQPIGIPGELGISGDGLARGYTNNPGLTAEKFVPHPFKQGERLYMTGDIACWLPDGNIDFIGRQDNQVKVRGFRIELAEIEKQLLQHEAIKQAVVLLHRDIRGDNDLCAYFVSGKALKISGLREYLSGTLPGYMIPAYFVRLSQLPLMTSGKIDRKALPEPGTVESSGLTYVPPGNKMETRLLGIWREVLGIKNIGIYNNFFELGGQSFKAMVLTAKIHESLNVKVPLSEIFSKPTIKELAQYIGGEEENPYATREPGEEKEYYPASSAQKRLFILNQFENIGTSYNMPAVYKMDIVLDKAKLVNIFETLMERHESLRTSFKLVDDKPVQQIHPRHELEFDIQYDRVSKNQAGIGSEPGEVERKIRAFVRPFDLEKAPLLRVGNLEISDKENLLLFDMHHIISDGTSMGILADEFARLSNGEELPLLTIQYRDFACWQDQLIDTGKIKEQEKYWLNLYKDEIPRLDLPCDYPRPGILSFEGANYEFTLGVQEFLKLKQMGTVHETTLYMNLLAAFNVLLYKYSGQEDIIVGCATAGRSHVELQDIIGMFVNILAMKNSPSGRKRFREFLAEVKKNSIHAFENQDFQFEDLVDKLYLERDLSRNPLFDVSFVVHNFPDRVHQLDRDIARDIRGQALTPLNYENRTAKFDLTLHAFEAANDIRFTMEFRTTFFKKETIQRIANHFLNIIRQVTGKPDLLLAETDMMSKEEKQRLLYEFNETVLEYPPGKTLPELFTQQVRKTPDRTAVTDEEEFITYRELDENANRLGNYLYLEKDIQPDQRAALFIDQSIHRITAMLGVLKAGAAFVPLEPSLPGERIKWIIRDSEAKFIISREKYSETLHQLGKTCKSFPDFFFMDRLRSLEAYNKNSVPSPLNAQNLAYLIYTSGTTGNPKGVMIEHEAVVNLCFWAIRYYKITKREHAAQYASFGFDASILEIFPYLLTGSALYIISDEIKLNTGELFSYYEKNLITITFLPTQLCEQFMKYEQEPCSLEKLQTGGDKLRAFYKKKYELHNNYGPTENTVVTTIHLVDRFSDNIPIGKPIANNRIYILNKDNLQLHPIGVPGELCVSGPGLARGYLKQPGLTEQKFIMNPHIPGERIYRTGDLARWLGDGNLEIIGRLDNQVKIRGARIELGEIETQLLKYEEVKETVVLAKKDERGEKYLCAYYAAGKELEAPELRTFLSAKVPQYMIPAYFIYLKEIPLTKNGKLDRKALPDPRIKIGDKYAAPGDEVEEKLAAIWSEVLGIEKDIIGRHSNFFELGGHSLKATIMIAKIDKALKVKLPLAEVFKTPILEELAAHIKEAGKSKYISINPAEYKEYYQLSSAQQRIYISQQMDEKISGYYMPYEILLDFEIHRERLEQAYRKLVKRHESLRTSFRLVEEEPVQEIEEEIKVKIEYYQAGKVEKITNDFHRPFDLARAPLIRVGLIKINEKKHILLFDLHHIITDGKSQEIIAREFKALYNGAELPPLRLQYKDYAEWQDKQAQTGLMKKQETFWLNQFKGKISLLNLPTDSPRRSTRNFIGNRIRFVLNEKESKALKELAKENKVTLYMAILALFNILLAKLSGQEDIIVGTPAAGRLHDDLEPIVGMFVNTLALKNFPSGEKIFKNFIEEVKERTLQAFENQDYQFENLVEKVLVKRDASRNPIFDVMLVLQNRSEQPMDAAVAEVTDLPDSYEFYMVCDLVLTVLETGQNLLMSFSYNNALFKAGTIRDFIKYFREVISSAAENIEIKIRDIKISHQFFDEKLAVPGEEEGDFKFIV